MISLSLIIPTYNEAKNLPLLLEEIWNVVDKDNIDLEFIIVDDNSPDGTGKVADELAAKYPVQVIHRPGKMGLGSAVIAGFKKSERPFVGVMDADLSHDPAILNQLILSLSEYDIAMGGRFEVESSAENWTLSRKMISGTGVFLARLLTGVKDPLSGYFFMDRKVIEGVNLTTVGYKILLEILVKGRYDKVKELPYTFRMRKYSTSKLNYKEFLLFLEQVVAYSFLKLIKKSHYGKQGR